MIVAIAGGTFMVFNRDVATLYSLVSDVIKAPVQDDTTCWYGRMRKRASSMSYTPTPPLSAPLF